MSMFSNKSPGDRSDLPATNSPIKLSVSTKAKSLAPTDRVASPSRVSIVPVLTSELIPALLERLGEIYATCFKGAPWNETWTATEASKVCRDFATGGGDILVLRNGVAVAGLIIGLPIELYAGRDDLASFVSGRAPYYLAELAVDPRDQNRGFGGRLIVELTRVARSAGYDEVLTRTRIDNLRAIAAFQRSGFEVVGNMEASTGGVASTRVVLRLELDSIQT